MISIATLSEFISDPEAYEDKYTRSILQDAITCHIPLLSRKRVLEAMAPLDDDVRLKLAIIVLCEGDPVAIEDLLPQARRNPNVVFGRVLR